ncbi:cyclic nucleotide-binding domain-containing protein [Gilvimarinus sp. F26214L]|uniref:cyclic nucleotide-binding domain-containing protein n=1 Tax=Gilvimarinus sp. DZF01 TaxID=3461371 RepID=UPI00404649F4
MRGTKRVCSSCSAASYCLCCDLKGAELQLFEDLPGTRRVLRRGERLFAQGEPFHSFFVVQSGSAKAYVISEDGNQQITGFHYRGDLLGVDGLELGMQSYTVEALETSSICELAFADFERMYAGIPSLRRQFLKVVAGELAQEKQRMLVLGKLYAEQRLAHFILDTATHLKSRGLTSNEFMLTMTRHDIANYLGLAVETISRLLTRFDSAALIRVQHRQIRLLNPAGLRALLYDTDEGLTIFRATA